MKGVITAKVVNVFPVDTTATTSGGSFSKRVVWLLDDITDARYPNYYTIEFQGQAIGIPDSFQYMQQLTFDVEVKGRMYTKPGTNVDNIFTTIRCWRATPVAAAPPAPVQQPNPYAAQPAGFYPATQQQHQQAAAFMPPVPPQAQPMTQPGMFGGQPGGFQPPAQQPGGFPGSNQGTAQPAPNGFNGGQPAGGFQNNGFAPAGVQTNGFNQAVSQPGGFQQPGSQPGNSADVAGTLPF